jgi:hypothetical protein
VGHAQQRKEDVAHAAQVQHVMQQADVEAVKNAVTGMSDQEINDACTRSYPAMCIRSQIRLMSWLKSRARRTVQAGVRHAYDTHNYRNKKYVDIGCLVGGRKLFVWTLGVLLVVNLVRGRRILSRLRALAAAQNYDYSMVSLEGCLLC